jgi:addiction module HigA family antidote
MTVHRKDSETGWIDLSDLADLEHLPFTHPGTLLTTHYLKPLGITPYRLAKDIKVPLNRITAILAGKRAVTPDTALRLARYLGTPPALWVTLQALYDLEITRQRSELRLLAIARR